jgi:hypothetical protein
MTSTVGITTNIIITLSQAKATTTSNLMTRMSRATISTILPHHRNNNTSGRAPPRNTNAITNPTLSMKDKVTRTKIIAQTKFPITPYKIITIPPKKHQSNTPPKITLD